MPPIIGGKKYMLFRAISGLISDTVAKICRVDAVTETLQTIDYAHHEIHGESHYFGKQSSSLTGAGTTGDFLFVTPNTATRIHAKATFSASDEFLVQLYEGTTTTTPNNDGTPVTTFNNDRDSSNTAELLAYTAPSVATLGTLIWEGYLTGNRGVSGVDLNFGYEIIAKTNTKYLFRITKTNSGTHRIDTDFYWYEHAPRN